ncbi:response regulator receiver modulated diguanylate cyclase [Nitrosospira sp. Nl5]|uniref:GGDEF domain-containing response regulator n=1 Tax=Nitrosospira sp. Nl5 TaxID=200120 RepID=UPI0008821F9A|nr:diguanylate cyclase [Nitrosospira sp. Nl5]SCX95418.1 response regulator receiver modulated diguanylate cyclase [Nitrosospira sp. Nl5]
MKILIAEDDTTSRLLFGATLRKLGYAVTAVENGQKAWDAWKQDGHSLLISDWMMPDIDGLELCRMIRAEPSLQYTYIILLTALDSKGSYLEGMDAGADDFITKPFDEEQLAARLRVAERILALHKKLHVQATHDRLTGVWNRAAIMDCLERELGRAARESSRVGVVLADLDHFKRVNDTHGHPTGDAVLQEAARRMRLALRPYDRIGRYGGEEFLVTAPGCTLSEAMALAERIRDSISAGPVDCQSGVIPMTASLGVAVGGNRTGEDAGMLIAAADEALYRAKRAGRNRVEFSKREV